MKSTLKNSIAGGLILLTSLGGLVTASPAHADTWGPNEAMTWDISSASTSGVSNITFPMTVGDRTYRDSGTYFGMVFYFTKSGTGAVGLQTLPDAGGKARLRAVFKGLAAGTTSTDKNCQPEIPKQDTGQICATEFDATLGHTYDMKVENTTGNTWTGTAVDTTTKQEIHIGTWTLKKESQVHTFGYGFAMNMDDPDCSLPYFDITFGNPTSGSTSGSVNEDDEGGGCEGKGVPWIRTVDAGGGLQITRGIKGHPTEVRSVTREDKKLTITGWAKPGSRLKTTNDPNVGWFDPEGGNVYADADGFFTLVTQRAIQGAAAVKSFDPVSGAALSESNHVKLPPRSTAQ